MSEKLKPASFAFLKGCSLSLLLLNVVSGGLEKDSK